MNRHLSLSNTLSAFSLAMGLVLSLGLAGCEQLQLMQFEQNNSVAVTSAMPVSPAAAATVSNSQATTTPNASTTNAAGYGRPAAQLNTRTSAPLVTRSAGIITSRSAAKGARQNGRVAATQQRPSVVATRPTTATTTTAPARTAAPVATSSTANGSVPVQAAAPVQSAPPAQQNVLALNTTPSPLSAQPEISDAEQLTRLVVRAWPVGPMLEGSLARDRNWPMGNRATDISSAQLQCLRQRLSAAGYQASRSVEVERFVNNSPELVPDAIEVLEQGGADIMAATFFKVRQTGASTEVVDLQREFTSAQIAKFNSLTTGDAYRSLRKLLIGNDHPLVDRVVVSDVAATFGRQLIRNAMDYCRVPLSVVQ